MELDWKKIKDGYTGFEKLAVEFINAVDMKPGKVWTETKHTRDNNHDAVMVFYGYEQNNELWWMEAKYSSLDADNKSEKKISRYRLDSTIVTAILAKRVSRVIFVTNLNIKAKTIYDIKMALYAFGVCVSFYTQGHLEHWLLDRNYPIFSKHFDLPYSEYCNLSFPVVYVIEQLNFYSLSGKNFQEALNILHTNHNYEVRFSIAVQKQCRARIVDAINFRIIDEEEYIELKKGLNDIALKIQTFEKIQEEVMTEKDILGDYMSLLPIQLRLEVEKTTVEITTEQVVDLVESTNLHIELQTQDKIVKDIVMKLEQKLKLVDTEFEYYILQGKSGVGKSYTIKEFQKKISQTRPEIHMNQYSFVNDKFQNILRIKRMVFEFFFPFLFYEDMDQKYIDTVKNNSSGHFSNYFWDFISQEKSFEDFMNAYSGKKENLMQVFPDNISVNIKVIIFDNLQCLDYKTEFILRTLLTSMARKNYPVFCIFVSQNQIKENKLRVNKNVRISINQLTINSNDIRKAAEKFGILWVDSFEVLFASVMDVLYFIKYILEMDTEVSTLEEYKLAFHTFRNSNILQNEIHSKFENIFQRYPFTQDPCAFIYYCNSGLKREEIISSPKWVDAIQVLLKAQLIRMSDDDYFLPWHDYYREIFIKNYDMPSNIDIKLDFNLIHNLKNSVSFHKYDDQKLELIINQLLELFEQQKYHTLMYILEDIYNTPEGKSEYRGHIRTEYYYKLFAIYCYANANAGTIHSGYEKFYELYQEVQHYSFQCNVIYSIKYITMFELINALYEMGDFEQAAKYITLYKNMPKHIINNWVPFLGWRYEDLTISINSIGLLTEAVDGVNNLNSLPNADKIAMMEKDIAFSSLRLILANLTNDFSGACGKLIEFYNIIKDHPDCDNKTLYMYEFKIKFLECLEDKISIEEVVSANVKLKEQFFNDYNRHLFALAALAFIKCSTDYCTKIYLEHMKMKRRMKLLPKAFNEMISLLISISSKNKSEILESLKLQEDYLSSYETYLPVIRHNICYISNKEFRKEDVCFYTGDKMEEGKFYLDIRMI